MNKKTKKVKSLVNKNLKTKNCIDDCSDNFNFDCNYDDDSLFNKFYGLEEEEEEKLEDQDEDQDNLNSIQENIFDIIEPIFEKEKKTINENDDIFKAEDLKGVLCNQNIYNKAFIEDDENNEERRFTATYELAPIEDNTSTYYKSKI